MPRVAALLVLALVALPAAAWPVGPAPTEGPRAAAACAATDPVPPVLVRAGLVAFKEDPEARFWEPWLVDAGEVPVPPPPDMASARTAEELAELHGWALNRTDEQVRLAQWVDRGAAVDFWTDLFLNELIEVGAFGDPGPAKNLANHGPTRVSRELALFEIALHDAMVAAWVAKACYLRPAPYLLDPALQPVVARRPLPSYPSEHAVAAGVAVEMLKHFFPCPDPPLDCDGEPPEVFEAAAMRAAETRVWGGGNYRSDIEAGMALGRAVARLVLERRADDGSDAAWDGQRPRGPCLWEPTPPVFRPLPLHPHWAKVQPFLLPAGDAARPAPGPACGSEEYLGQHRVVLELSRHLSDEQKDAARQWDAGLGTGWPPAVALRRALVEAREANLTTMGAARLLSHVATAGADAVIASWDAKMHAWSERPITIIRRTWDPTWTPYMTTPPFPLDASLHGAVYAATFTTLAHLVPERAADLRNDLFAAASSRLYTGGDTPWAIDDGLAMGRAIAERAIARAEAS